MPSTTVIVDVAVGYVLELVADLGDRHILAGDEPVEDGTGDARVFAVGAGAFLAFGAFGGVGGGLEFGVGSYERVGGDGAVFHVPLHLKALGDHGSKHVAEVFEVDEVAGGELVDANVGSGLGEDVELGGVEPLGSVDDALFVVGIEVPAEGDEEHEGDGAGLDLAAGDAAVARSRRGRWA